MTKINLLQDNCTLYCSDSKLCFTKYRKTVLRLCLFIIPPPSGACINTPVLKTFIQLRDIEQFWNSIGTLLLKEKYGKGYKKTEGVRSAVHVTEIVDVKVNQLTSRMK